MRKLIPILLFFLFSTGSSMAQINFNVYYDYPNDFPTGQYTLEFPDSFGNDVQTIALSEAVIIPITGVKYLDIRVDFSGDEYLYLDGVTTSDPNKRIDFELKASYANNAGTPSLSSAKQIINTSGTNTFTTYFPLLERQGQPPNAPPPPPTNEFDYQSVKETAYLYVYGTITVGDVNAGIYSSDISITISYD